MEPFVHTLNRKDHILFLNEKRCDPLTHERITEGDRIVICSGCKSAHLLHSWNDNNRKCPIKGCESESTLNYIPQEDYRLQMEPYVHKLNRNEHLLFLKEKRSDPLTKERILEGDRVVVCLGCESVHLLASWNDNDYKCPVITSTHVTKDAIKDKKYDGTSIKETVELFYDAKLILFIDTDIEDVEEEGASDDLDVKIIVSKNKFSGYKGVLPFTFYRSTSKIEEKTVEQESKQLFN